MSGSFKLIWGKAYYDPPLPPRNLPLYKRLEILDELDRIKQENEEEWHRQRFIPLIIVAVCAVCFVAYLFLFHVVRFGT